MYDSFYGYVCVCVIVFFFPSVESCYDLSPPSILCRILCLTALLTLSTLAFDPPIEAKALLLVLAASNLFPPSMNCNKDIEMPWKQRELWLVSDKEMWEA